MLTAEGYRMTPLSKNGKVKARFVHRLMLFAFVGPCPKDMEACHNDGNSLNNNLDNLRWDTRQENVRDVDRHGKRAKGEQNGSTKLTTSKVLHIRKLFELGHTRASIARKYKVDFMTIHYIITRRNWKHI